MGDVKESAAGSLEQPNDSKNEGFITINTIDETVYVERLPNPLYLSRGSGGIVKYGYDNLYPDKVKSMAERSQSTSTAIETLARFTAGEGFKDKTTNELIVNSEELTLFDILDHVSDEKAEFNGFALHFNYNPFGEIIEIQEIPFQTLRYKSDFEKIVFCPDWSKSGRFSDNKKIEYNLFDPDNVQQEIEDAGGIEEYNGQVLYWIPKRKQIYTLCRFDAALDDSQFEHESGVYKLRNVQNGYSAGYVMLYPSQIESTLEKYGLMNDTKKSRGAGNAGKTKHIPVNNNFFEAIGSRKIIEEIPRNGIDKFFQKQNEETKFNIYAKYSQPPILNGISKDGMFNQESFTDAFDYYNSITEKDRQKIERVFNKFMSHSIWNVGKLEIDPLKYISRRDVNGVEITEEKPKEDGEKNNT